MGLAKQAEVSNTRSVREGDDQTYEEARRARWGTLPERVLPTDWVEMKAVDPATGKALFNQDAAGGAYACARCHTRGWSISCL